MEKKSENLITPQWDAAAGVRALVTTRLGGVSDSPHHSFNLSPHVGDDLGAVEENRLRLQVHLPAAPKWMRQGHTARVVRAEEVESDATVADAVHSDSAGVVCAALVADCLPVLFCAEDGGEVAAAHAGWRGLAGGVLENTVAAMRADNPHRNIAAWIGPCIAAAHYPVGDEVRQALCQNDEDGRYFSAQNDGKYLADLSGLAVRRLQKMQVNATAANLCTYSDSARFFSARRDGVRTGRIAALVWRSE